MNNIVLCGFMGCGKSTVGKLLAAHYGYRFVDMDSYIEHEAGCTVSELFAAEGESGFRRREHDACVALAKQTSLVIATGGGAVLFKDNVTALEETGTIVWLKVTPACVLSRLEGDTTRPLLQRPDKEAAVHTLLNERTPLYERAAHLTVDADGDAAQVADAVCRALSAR